MSRAIARTAWGRAQRIEPGPRGSPTRRPRRERQLQGVEDVERRAGRSSSAPRPSPGSPRPRTRRALRRAATRSRAVRPRSCCSAPGGVSCVTSTSSPAICRPRRRAGRRPRQRGGHRPPRRSRIRTQRASRRSRTRERCSKARGETGSRDENRYRLDVTTWADSALAVLRAAGLRRGGARQAVVEFLAAKDCCRSAQEIHDGIRASGGASGWRASPGARQLSEPRLGSE